MMHQQWEFAFADATTKARATDPDTCREAALANLPLKDTQRREILELHSRHPDGLTDDECSELCSIRLNSLTTRRSELYQGGWLEDSGLRRLTTCGISAIVWRITAKTKLLL